MELFRINSKIFRCVIYRGVCYPYLGYYVVDIQQYFVDTASLVTGTSVKNASVTNSIHYINKSILWSEISDVDHTNEEVLNSLEGRIGESVDTFYAWHVRRYIPSGYYFLIGFHYREN
jgi:hypothetical protein